MQCIRSKFLFFEFEIPFETKTHRAHKLASDGLPQTPAHPASVQEQCMPDPQQK